jgi:hypothetical protein
VAAGVVTVDADDADVEVGVGVVILGFSRWVDGFSWVACRSDRTQIMG